MKTNSVYYLIIAESTDKLTGWTTNPFITKEYYRLLSAYEVNPHIITFNSKQELQTFVYQTSSKLFNMTIDDGIYDNPEIFVDSLEIVGFCSDGIGGGKDKYVLSTYYYMEDLRESGYMDGLMSDAYVFSKIMLESFEKLFLFLREPFSDMMIDKLALLVDYANLSIIRSDFDCSMNDYNTELNDEEFQMIRESFLSSTGMDIVYGNDDRFDSYNGIFDDIAWLVKNGVFYWLV